MLWWMIIIAVIAAALAYGFWDHLRQSRRLAGLFAPLAVEFGGELVKPSLLGTAYGLLFMLQAIGLFVSNLLAGGLNDRFQAGAENPAGYTGMLIFFGTLAAAAFVFAWLLWQRERGPNNHGLEEPR